jgi:hypothetical protein
MLRAAVAHRRGHRHCHSHHNDGFPFEPSLDNGVACSGEVKAFSRNRPNPNVIVGALVGGPDVQDNYKDDRAMYHYTEVALDYNAGLTAALAALIASPTEFWLSDCSPWLPSYPFAVEWYGRLATTERKNWKRGEKPRSSICVGLLWIETRWLGAEVATAEAVCSKRNGDSSLSDVPSSANSSYRMMETGKLVQLEWQIDGFLDFWLSVLAGSEYRMGLIAWMSMIARSKDLQMGAKGDVMYCMFPMMVRLSYNVGSAGFEGWASGVKDFGQLVEKPMKATGSSLATFLCSLMYISMCCYVHWLITMAAVIHWLITLAAVSDSFEPGMLPQSAFACSGFRMSFKTWHSCKWTLRYEQRKMTFDTELYLSRGTNAYAHWTIALRAIS